MFHCSKIIKLFSLSNSNKPMMKRAIYVVFTSLALLSMAACTKEYHCSCTYNNNVVYTVDLGMQYKANAERTCQRYDSTIKGIPWQCTLY